MSAKVFALACLFTLSIAAPLPIPYESANPRFKPSMLYSSRACRITVKRNSDGPLTDANGYRCTQHYTVLPGDTCTSVSIGFGLSLTMLMNMNTELGEDCRSFSIGQQLCVQTIVSENPGRSFVLNGLQ
ncbi:hypothetical protein DFH09DRAFT_1086176 [Mycena vulgaris]|nr:hypothetical protein DFH09DRAFT_1086176 [Mycena vulgaris]